MQRDRAKCKKMYVKKNKKFWQFENNALSLCQFLKINRITNL